MTKILGLTSDDKVVVICVDDDGHLQIDNLDKRSFGETAGEVLTPILVDDDGHLQIDNLDKRIYGQTAEEVILPILVDDDGKIITTTNGDGAVTASSCFMETGTYDGDGTTGNVVLLVDTELIVKYAVVWQRQTVHGQGMWRWESTNTMIDDSAFGLACIPYHTATVANIANINALIALGTGSITVDDADGNHPPNSNGVEYNYMVLGVHAV